MEGKYFEVSQRVSPSVVIVSEPGASKSSNYCIGFVIVATEGATFVITQSSIVKSAQGNVSVHFSDGKVLDASVQVTGPCFCLLRTDPHPGCMPVKLVETDERPPITSDVMTLTPALHYALYSSPGFVLLESCESTGTRIDDYIVDSEKEFLVSCDYAEMWGNGNSRLLGGPVFDMDEQVLGIVTGDYGSVDPRGVRSGFEIKTTLLAKHVSQLILELVQDKHWIHHKKEGDKDWKGHLQSLSFQPGGKRKRGAGATKAMVATGDKARRACKDA